MKKFIVLSTTMALLLGLGFVVPQEKSTKADYTKPSLVSISTGGKILSDADGVINLSKYTPVFPIWDVQRLAYVEGWAVQNPNYPVGTEFQVVIDTKKQEPYVVVSEGEVQSWSYDAATGYTTINAKSIIIPGREGRPDMNGLITAVVLGITDPNVPAEQIKGVHVSTNAHNWEIIPPKERGKEGMRFGYIITGKDGYDGFFRMYIPKALLDFMHVKPSELAGFIDGNQASVDVTETADGGAIISLTLTYSTYRVEAGKALPLSLTASKTKVKKGEKVTLYGWLGTKQKGKDIVIYKKEKGKKTYERVTVVKTKKDGYFSKTFTLKKNAAFKALHLKIKKGKAVKKIWSKAVAVKVKKDKKIK